MTDSPRRPRVFAPDDPKLELQPEPAVAVGLDGDGPGGNPGGARVAMPTAAGVSRGIRVGAVFVSALVALATLAASVSFLRFVSVALERDDWVGWTAVGLLGLVALSAMVFSLMSAVVRPGLEGAEQATQPRACQRSD